MATMSLRIEHHDYGPRYHISYACPGCDYGIYGDAYDDRPYGLMRGECPRGHQSIVEVPEGLEVGKLHRIPVPHPEPWKG